MIEKRIPGLMGVTLAQTAALLPPFAVLASNNLASYAIMLVAAVVAALGWEVLFGLLRKRGLSFHGVTTALIVASLSPTDLAIWQVLVVVSLGTILGELVFGGRGFGFLNPATLALALLIISFPQLQLPLPTQVFTIAVIPGAVLLMVLGLISGRVLVAAVLTYVTVLVFGGHEIDPASAATGLGFALVFLIADPVTAASTNPGRLLYGALAGGLIAVFSAAGESMAHSVVLAALMAGIFAPLSDHLVVLCIAYRRSRATRRSQRHV